jgi:hypothetical protein
LVRGPWSPINITDRPPSKICLLFYFGKDSNTCHIKAFRDIIYNLKFLFQKNKYKKE